MERRAAEGVLALAFAGNDTSADTIFLTYNGNQRKKRCIKKETLSIRASNVKL